MSQLSSYLQTLEAKIKQTETNVANTLAQYHGLSGILAGLKASLADAQTIVNVVAPESAIADSLNVSEEVVNVAEGIESALQPIASPTEDVPQ